MDEGINKLWNIHTMEYNAAIKRKVLLPHEWTLKYSNRKEAIHFP